LKLKNSLKDKIMIKDLKTLMESLVMRKNHSERV